MPYNPKGTKLRYCKECGELLGYRNKSGYCPNHYGIYNKQQNLARYMIEYNRQNGIWNKGREWDDETRKKISETVSKTTVWKTMRKEDGYTTKAEDLFAKHNPTYKREVTFGTGLGGIRKYKTNYFRADFYDRANNTVYEIDGSSHNIKGRKERDIRKDTFFNDIGISVVRISNKEVFCQYE